MSNGKRGRPKDEYISAVIDALHEQYPKFTRQQMSMIKNPLYGIQMSSEAISVLESKDITPPGKIKKKSVKKNQRRNKQNRYSVRLNDTQKVRFEEQLKQSGCKTVQEYLERLIMKGE